MVGADARCHRKLEFLGLGDPLGGQIGRPEWLRDHDFRIGKLALEHRVGAVLVRRHDQGMAEGLDVFSQAQFARDAAEQHPRLEVDRLRRRQGLAAGITFDLRQIVARVGFRIAVNRIVIENAKNLRHLRAPWNLVHRETRTTTSNLLRPRREVAPSSKPTAGLTLFSARFAAMSQRMSAITPSVRAGAEAASHASWFPARGPLGPACRGPCHDPPCSSLWGSRIERMHASKSLSLKGLTR